MVLEISLSATIPASATIPFRPLYVRRTLYDNTNSYIRNFVLECEQFQLCNNAISTPYNLIQITIFCKTNYSDIFSKYSDDIHP